CVLTVPCSAWRPEFCRCAHPAVYYQDPVVLAWYERLDDHLTGARPRGRAPVSLTSFCGRSDAHGDAAAVVATSRLDHDGTAELVGRPDRLDLGPGHHPLGHRDAGPRHQLLGQHLVASDVHADRRGLLGHRSADEPPVAPAP